MNSALAAALIGACIDVPAISAQANEAVVPVIRGVVVDTAGQPLANVQVQRKGKKAVLSGDDGRFSVPVDPKDKLQIELRRVGLYPARYVAPLPPDTAVTLVMYYMPQRLPAVEAIAVRKSMLEGRGFYRRLEERTKGAASGYFVTPEELDRRMPTRVTMAVEGFPGIKVMQGVNTGSQSNYDSPMLMGTDNCVMTIWLDGVRITPDSTKTRLARRQYKDVPRDVLSENQKPISHSQNVQLDQLISGSSVAAIEVYPRSSMIPPEFYWSNSTCGAVVIWLKGKGDK